MRAPNMFPQPGFNPTMVRLRLDIGTIVAPALLTSFNPTMVRLRPSDLPTLRE